MRIIAKWIERIHDQSEKNEVPTTIYATCFNPNAGCQLVVGAGDKVLVYDSDGALIDTLKGHKNVVTSLSYSSDGKRFASGSLDKTVIIWTSKLEGTLKYSHYDAIQCLEFNPVTHQLASCAISDFAFWSSEQKSVQKFKVSSKINCCSWTSDGQFLALGHANGIISIRNIAGDEKIKIDRGKTSICDLQWSPLSSSNPADSLAVVDWKQTLSFYTITGNMIGKERSLGFDPLCLRYLSDGETMVVTGCNKQLQLFTREGIRLGALGDAHSSWIWSVSPHPSGTSVVIGCQDGSLAYYQLSFSTVHAMYRERYAFRENMCDVIIQHLVSGQKVRIKCRDLVHKIAIYRHRLAVQLPERVVLYELDSPDTQPMHYRVKEKISQRFNCSLLVVCAENLVLCHEKKLQSLNFSGELQKEWIFDSFIRYIKVIGGSSGREGLMIGLKNGQVFSIFLDNSLAILITEVQSSVRCLDLNSTRTKVAIVDDAGRLVVRDLENDCILFQDIGVNSVAWNNTLESMLCYSHTNGGLSIRVGTLPPSLPPQQSFVGVVVGLSGYTAFCLKGNVMNTVALSLSATLWQFIEANLFENAYEVACLGVTENDWESLAIGALEALNMKIAKSSFIKTRNLAWLEFIEEIELVQKYNDLTQDTMKADILAFQGKFKEAAGLYKKSGLKSKAVTLFTDLKMFDLAKDFLKDDTDMEDSKELIRKRAEWACSVHEQRTAVELLLSAGDVERAIEIVAQEKWPDMLIAIGRKLDVSQRENLELIGDHLKRLQALPLAAEIYKKLGMESQVVQLHVEARDWTEAFKLAENYPEMMKTVHYEHAKWLSESDQFFEAYESYMKAGKPNDAFKLLKNLTDNALKEERFSDAGYFTWIKAKQILKNFESRDDINEQQTQLFNQIRSIASIYYAYAIIHSYIREPFTSSPPLTLFNTARFIVNQIGSDPPPKGVSLFALYYTLSKQAKILGSMKLHLMINNKLQNLKTPAGIQEQVDMSIINSRTTLGGFSDPEELLQMCYKCSNFNMHLSGNKCSNCNQKFIFSYVSFEILPLVEFYPAQDIPCDDAERLLMAPPKRVDYDLDENSHHHAFEQNTLNEYLPMILSRDELRSLDPRNVIVVKRQHPFVMRFFKNLMPEIHVVICTECQNAFHAEDFENQVLQKKSCPFCRAMTQF